MEDKVPVRVSTEEAEFYARKYLREDIVKHLIPILAYELGADGIIKHAEKLEEYIMKR